MECRSQVRLVMEVLPRCFIYSNFSFRRIHYLMPEQFQLAFWICIWYHPPTYLPFSLGLAREPSSYRVCRTSYILSPLCCSSPPFSGSVQPPSTGQPQCSCSRNEVTTLHCNGIGIGVGTGCCTLEQQSQRYHRVLVHISPPPPPPEHSHPA